MAENKIIEIPNNSIILNNKIYVTLLKKDRALSNYSIIYENNIYTQYKSIKSIDEKKLKTSKSEYNIIDKDINTKKELDIKRDKKKYKF